MISFVVAAVLTTAPEANVNLFKRRHHAAPAECSTCAPAPCADAPCAGAPATQETPKGEPAKVMPKGDAPKTDAPKGDKAAPPVKTDAPKAQPAPKTDAPKADAPKGDKAAVVEKKAEAPIEIPKNLMEAINKSDQKAQILDYLNNPAVPRENRVQYLETVRQTLLPNEPKK
jgi:hypothetical protein